MRYILKLYIVSLNKSRVSAITNILTDYLSTSTIIVQDIKTLSNVTSRMS